MVINRSIVILIDGFRYPMVPKSAIQTIVAVDQHKNPNPTDIPIQSHRG